MKTNSQNVFISLPEELGEEIEVTAEFIIDNDGIGPYEYWGQKCYDAGQDYAVVENIIPIFTDHPDEIKILISKYIDDNFESLSNDAAMSLTFEPDYGDD